jgi:hypothetical protein
MTPAISFARDIDMYDLDKQQWRELCQRAVGERSPERFSKIIQEANNLTAEKKPDLTRKSPESAKT